VLYQTRGSGSPILIMRTIPVQQTQLRCEVVSDFRRLHELSSEWTRLWKSDPQAEIFQTPEWAIAWWRSFGHSCTLCSLVVFADDEVIGIVPLIKRDGVIQFLGTPEADYADMICEEKWAQDVLAVAFKTLRGSITGWSECVWQHLSKDSRVMRHYRALPQQLLGNLRCLPTERYQTILFRDNRDAVFSSLLGKKHTRRRRNKLQKAGQVRFRHLQTQQAARTFLNDFFHHHVRRHAAIGKRSVYAAPESCQFIRTLFAKLGSAVRFGVLELDGRPLAWHFGFQVNGKLLLYQHTFDLDAADYTPGELLLWNLFEYTRDHVARELDFGRGDESYKNRFANHSRETFSLFIEPFGLKGRTRGLARKAQAYLVPHLLEIKQIAKSHHPSLRTFRFLRIWLLRTSRWVRRAKNKSLVRYRLLPEEKIGNSVWRKRSSDVFSSETPQHGMQAR
jgi:CelD/BcsL family acetyltransferase involved in cellulose biosynthesis